MDLIVYHIWPRTLPHIWIELDSVSYLAPRTTTYGLDSVSYLASHYHIGLDSVSYYASTTTYGLDSVSYLASNYHIWT